MQCRQQLHVKAGVKSATRTELRPSLSSPARRPLVLPATFVAGQRRALATVQSRTDPFIWCVVDANEGIANSEDQGPLKEYDDRVATGRLKDDEHQRGDYIVFPKQPRD